jgi:hypothetical protein
MIQMDTASVRRIKRLARKSVRSMSVISRKMMRKSKMSKNDILKIRGAMSEIVYEDFLPNPRKYSRAELQYAFTTMTSGMDNWKNSFYTKILHEDFELCNAACLFFTGSKLQMESMEENGEILNCYCAGYYRTIGA